MRIISDFHDYYDYVMKFGFDPKRIYHRKSQDLYHENAYIVSIGGYQRLTLNKYLIGFCGKIYPLIKYVIHNDYINPIVAYCYSASKLDDAIKLQNEKYRDYFSKQNYFDKPTYGCSKQVLVQEWFVKNEQLETQQRLHKFFLLYKTPIFILDGYNITDKLNQNKYLYKISINSRLQDYDFYHIKDGYSTYGEIEQFISNNLVGEKHIPEMSNDVKIQAAGFNLKESFRKPKTKK